MIEAVWDCGAVRLTIAEAPEEVNDCQCVWCQRLGAPWAYYPKGQVRFLSERGATAVYLRGARKLEFHRCRICGLATHWVSGNSTQSRMGVNARLLPRNVRNRARVFQGQ